MKFRDAFPILYVADVERAADFYVTSFGFEIAFRWPAEGKVDFAFLKLDPLGIGIGSRGTHSDDDAFELCIYTNDVDVAAERLRASGAEEVASPEDQPWGERRAYFRDPDGHLLHVISKL